MEIINYIDDMNDDIRKIRDIATTMLCSEYDKGKGLLALTNVMMITLLQMQYLAGDSNGSKKNDTVMGV